MNIYHIPREAKPNQDYVDLINAMAWLGRTEMRIDFNREFVSTNGTTADTRATLQPLPPSRKDALITQLDKDCDDIYFKVLGFRDIEYINAESQAREFKSRAYTNPIPDLVAVYAAGAGITAQAAADYTIALSDSWRPAMSAIRMYRTQAKTALVASQDSAQEDAIIANWNGFVANIKSQLGIS